MPVLLPVWWLAVQLALWRLHLPSPPMWSKCDFRRRYGWQMEEKDTMAPWMPTERSPVTRESEDFGKVFIPHETVQRWAKPGFNKFLSPMPFWNTVCADHRNVCILGCLPNITRNAIVNCAELVTYDIIKELILKYDLMTGELFFLVTSNYSCINRPLFLAFGFGVGHIITHLCNLHLCSLQITFHAISLLPSVLGSAPQSWLLQWMWWRPASWTLPLASTPVPSIVPWQCWQKRDPVPSTKGVYILYTDLCYHLVSLAVT